MIIFPAIDLVGGKAVRLTQGDYARMKVYDDDPTAVAEGFLHAGANHLHVVDLDGAKSGSVENFPTIRAIAAQKGLFIQVGGGIRTMERIELYCNAGVSRVVLGTAAVKDPAFLKEAVAVWGERIAVGVDAKESKVALSGWLEKTELDSVSYCGTLRDQGIATVIYTDIAKDGALSGTNLEVYDRLSRIAGLNVVASGGISFEWELEHLRQAGISGAILGKALYEGKLDLKRAIAIAHEGQV